MTITAIERNARQRGRVDVYVDGVSRFGVTRATAKAHGLMPGRVIDDEEIARITAADERRRALDTAVTMLARRPRSEREVRRRLTQRHVAPALADETIARLRDAHFLDDAAFARSWTESRERASPRGRRMIVAELRTLGVDAETARAASAGIDEEDAAYRLASARARSLATHDAAKFRARLGGMLQRRGFGWSVTRAAVDRCWREFGADPADAPDAGIE